MPIDMNTRTTRTLYIFANERLQFLIGNEAGYIADSIKEMPGSDLFSDYKTDDELLGAIRFMDWIIDHVQYMRGEDDARSRQQKDNTDAIKY